MPSSTARPPAPPRLPAEDVEVLRTAVLAAALVLLVGVAVAMAAGRRWFGLHDVLGWVAVALAALGVVGVLGARTPGALLGVRALAVVAAALGGPWVAAAALVVVVGTVRHRASASATAVRAARDGVLRPLPPMPQRPDAGPPTAELPSVAPTEELPAVRT